MQYPKAFAGTCCVIYYSSPLSQKIVRAFKSLGARMLLKCKIEDYEVLWIPMIFGVIYYLLKKIVTPYSVLNL